MRVRYIHQTEHCTGNILWDGRFRMKAGKFPADHPLHGCTNGFRLSEQQSKVVGTDATPDVCNCRLCQFRARGYWASCFPEGDGITMKAESGQTPEQVRSDICEVFGWEIAPDKERGE